MELLLSMETVTSRKCINKSEYSLVNFMVRLDWLSVFMKSVSLSCPCVQIKKMLSM